MPNQDVLRRLAFIRHLYRAAVEQSRQPEPMAAAAVLTFHDAVELFLALAAEFKNVSVKATTPFMGYWAALGPSLPDGRLHHKAAMNRLNKARGGLKHGGIQPAAIEIEGFRASVTNFFEDNTPTVFECHFDQISMIELVESGSARDCLREAQKLIKQDEYREALVKIKLAFKEVSEEMTLGSVLSAFRSQTDFRTLDLVHINDRLVYLEDAIAQLACGINYFNQQKFNVITPLVLRMSGSYQAVWSESMPEPTLEDCRFCFDFVVDAAIRIRQATTSLRPQPVAESAPSNRDT